MSFKLDWMLSKNDMDEFGGADLIAGGSAKAGICNEVTFCPRRFDIEYGGVTGSGANTVNVSLSGEDRGRRIARGSGGSAWGTTEEDTRGGGEAIEKRGPGPDIAETNETGSDDKSSSCSSGNGDMERSIYIASRKADTVGDG